MLCISPFPGDQAGRGAAEPFRPPKASGGFAEDQQELPAGPHQGQALTIQQERGYIDLKSWRPFFLSVSLFKRCSSGYGASVMWRER